MANLQGHNVNRPTVLLLALSLAVLAGLFFTVHSRAPKAVEESRSAMGLDRYDETVRTLIDGGFFRYGGMLLMPHEQARGYWPEQLPSPIPSGAVVAYRSTTASHIIPLYALQRVYSAITGHQVRVSRSFTISFR
jgi:hypothetical protein